MYIGIAVYVMGIILGTIWFGVWARMRHMVIEEEDVFLFIAIIAIWPFELLTVELEGADK